MRICHSLSVMIAGLWIIVGTASSRAELPAMYQIEVKLIETMPDGKDLVLAHPQIMTLEGQPASIAIGQNIPPPKGIALQEPLRAGMFALVNVVRKDSQVFLDVTVNKSETSRAAAESVQITTRSVRAVELITLGKKIAVHPSQDKNLRWEFLVQRPQPKPSAGNTPIATPTRVSRRS